MTDFNGYIYDINKGCEKLIGLPLNLINNHSESQLDKIHIGELFTNFHEVYLESDGQYILTLNVQVLANLVKTEGVHNNGIELPGFLLDYFQ